MVSIVQVNVFIDLDHTLMPIQTPRKTHGFMNLIMQTPRKTHGFMNIINETPRKTHGFMSMDLAPFLDPFWTPS